MQAAHKYAGMTQERERCVRPAWHTERVLGPQELRDDEQAERAGIGRSLASQFSWDKEEIVAGWRLKFNLAPTGTSYSASLTNLNGATQSAFSTDDEGMIYEGKPLDDVDRTPPANRASQLLTSAAPIRSRRRNLPGRFGLFLATFIVPQQDQMEVEGGCTFCTEYPCACGRCCSCSGGWDGTHQCYNCGCESCVWCCCLYLP